MKLKKSLAVIATVCLASTLTTGFGLKDLAKEIKPDTDKCEKSSNKSDCKRKENLKTAAKVAAVGIAAKIIYDMVIDYRSKKVEDEDKVAEAYKSKFKNLPATAEVVAYESNLRPGQVVKPGEPVLLVSRVQVVPGKDGAAVLVQEKISIFDNEDPNKVIKSLVKNVSGASQKGGTYENEFSFTLPVGMPQGVYPIQTAVLLNEKETSTEKNEMQVVLQVMQDGRYLIALAN
ncbi:hypothetical protein [Saccharophagus sp. K07]|uniref:hypothetical protein n=1 Tax=Saccharophagus sp. K07 TaxID=2283636 RepID=UPI001652A6DB|nr:hypothetical protein [Saccharophagus sp. K07]